MFWGEKSLIRSDVVLSEPSPATALVWLLWCMNAVKSENELISIFKFDTKAIRLTGSQRISSFKAVLEGWFLDKLNKNK